MNCGFCLGFGCEVGAKSSSLGGAIRVAEQTGRCEIRPDSYVHNIEMDARGRVTGAAYFDKDKNTHLQKAKAVVVCANGAETPRLLLMSANPQFPNGLANSSGYVGKNLMLNSGAISLGVFEHPLNDYKGFAVSRILHDFYEMDPQKVGFYGGGGLDARFDITPIGFAMNGLPPDAPRWGKDFKKILGENFNRTMEVFAHATSLANEDNSFSLDPDLKDAWGLAGFAHDLQGSSQRYEDGPVAERSLAGIAGRGGRARRNGVTRSSSRSSRCTCWAPAGWATMRKLR